MNTELFNQANNGLVVKILGTDRTRSITAKNYLNNFLCRDREAIVDLNRVYSSYSQIMKDFGCKKPLALTGFVDIIKGSGYKIDNCLSTRYPASIIGLSFKTEPISVESIFIGIQKKHLRYLGININKLQNIPTKHSVINLLDKDDYSNGLNHLVSTPISETLQNKTDEKEDHPENKTEMIFQNKLSNIEIFESTEDNKTNEQQVIEEKPELKDFETRPIKNNIQKDKIKIYKDWLKANIDHLTAEQEYQFALYEFKLAKLKLFEEELKNKNLDDKDLIGIIERINNEIKTEN